MWDEKWEISNNQYKWYGMKWKCGVISHMAKRQTKSKTMWYRREGTRNGSHEVLLHCPGRNQAITDSESEPGLLKSLSFSCLSSSSIAEPWGPKTALYWRSTSFNVSETSDSRLLQRQERPLFRLSVSEKWKTNPNYHDIPTCFVIFVITHQN